MNFIGKHQNWIEERLLSEKKSIIDINKLEEYKKKARDYIPKRVQEIAEKHGCRYNKIKITSAKTRW
jgi:predicted metal-dependent hydrolase